MALFLCQQGLPSVKMCVVPQASQLPTSSSQEAEIQDYKGRSLLPCSSVTSHSHSEEPGTHHLPFIHFYLSFPDDVCRGFSTASYCTLGRAPQNKAHSLCVIHFAFSLQSLLQGESQFWLHVGNCFFHLFFVVFVFIIILNSMDTALLLDCKCDCFSKSTFVQLIER